MLTAIRKLLIPLIWYKSLANVQSFFGEHLSARPLVCELSLDHCETGKGLSIFAFDNLRVFFSTGFSTRKHFL